MSRLDFAHTTTTTTSALPSAERKLANKQRRKAGRERHEERKNHLKALEWDRKQERLDRDSQRQEKRPDDGTRAFAGRNPDSLAVSVSHLHLHPASPAAAAEGLDYKYEDEEEEVPAHNRAPAAPHATSGATLLAMARPAKVQRSRNRRHGRDDDYSSVFGMMTDGERFEIVEIDGRLVALDEDGWEILPDENAEASVSYSDIVRGNVR